jgi:repressor LexA
MALGITESTKSIPILGQIRAGLPIFAEENYEGGIEIPSDITADFALRVRGDSMIGAGILDGDYAICRKAETINAHSGQIVVAVRCETAEYAEATLKYFFENNGHPVLRAANPEYEDIDFDEEGYRVAGIMVALLRYGAPDYRIYREYISTRDYALQEWDEVIEKAATAGIKPSVIKELIDVQVEIAKRLKG